jgi:8-oxo-dGTP pyrophosphatase MutT (NUDIX family)
MREPDAAATAIVARDGLHGLEVFMLRRSSQSSFMPDRYVFPGGRLDSVDRSPAAVQRTAGSTAPLDPCFAYAAARETYEEAGLLFASPPVEPRAIRAARALLVGGARTFEQTLDDLQTAVDATAFTYFSRWITPPAEPRRFDARFFIARAPDGQLAEADAFETHDGIWITPSAALERHAGGTLALIFPTIKHLERIAPFTTVDALVAFAQTKTVVAVMPEILENGAIAMPAAIGDVW